MTTTNAFERILNRLGDADESVVKTASDQTPVTSEEAMLTAVRKVAENTKTASVPTVVDPVASLESMAKQAAAREQELLMKTAENMGAVICDGFFARMSQYNTALEGQGSKTATVATPEQIKEAASQGYKQAQADMEKEAEEAFKQGYDETLSNVYKTAAEIHYAGQTVAHQLIQESTK